MGGTLAFYIYTTYMQKFLQLSVGLSDNQTTWVSAGSLIFAMFLQPIYGALSDKIGRKPMLLASACSARWAPCRCSPPSSTRRARGKRSA